MRYLTLKLRDDERTFYEAEYEIAEEEIDDIVPLLREFADKIAIYKRDHTILLDVEKTNKNPKEYVKSDLAYLIGIDD